MWLPVLRNREFRHLWIASAIDSFGSWLLVTAVPLHVFARTGSAMSTGLALAVQAAPTVVIGPWAGVVIDRWHRKRVLMAANVVSAAAVGLMMSAPFLYLGLAVESIAACFLGPAIGAVTPSIVGRGADLAAANSLSAFTGSAFRMIGPLAGAFLVAGGWFEAVVLVDAATYLAAAAIIGRVAIPRLARPAGIPVELRHGLRHIARTPLLRGLLITGWAYWTVNAALTALLAPFVAVRWHSSGRALGLLIAGLGLGYLGGSALSKVLMSRFPARAVLVLAYASVGACFLATFTASALPVAVVALTAAGVPGAVAQIAAGQFRQISTPDAVLGRVSAVFFTGDGVAAVTGALIAPAIVALSGLAAALVVLSGTVLGTAATALMLLPATRVPASATAGTGLSGEGAGGRRIRVAAGPGGGRPHCLGALVLFFKYSLAIRREGRTARRVERAPARRPSPPG